MILSMQQDTSIPMKLHEIHLDAGGREGYGSGNETKICLHPTLLSFQNNGRL